MKAGEPMSDLEAIADRVEIEALRGEFSDAVMMNDHDRLASLFTPDGAVRIPLGNIEAVPGWFGIGGTSLSSPLWSAIIADRDGYQGQRNGNVNPLLYALYNIAPGLYFNDISGTGQATTNNGLFPATSGYDLASGIGTPKMAALITGSQ